MTKLISPRRPGLTPWPLSPPPQVSSTPWRGVYHSYALLLPTGHCRAFALIPTLGIIIIVGASASGCVTCILCIYHDFMKGPYFGALRSSHLANTQEPRGSPSPLLLPHVEVLSATSVCGYEQGYWWCPTDCSFTL